MFLKVDATLLTKETPTWMIVREFHEVSQKGFLWNTFDRLFPYVGENHQCKVKRCQMRAWGCGSSLTSRPLPVFFSTSLEQLKIWNRWTGESWEISALQVCSSQVSSQYVTSKAMIFFADTFMAGHFAKVWRFTTFKNFSNATFEGYSNWQKMKFSIKDFFIFSAVGQRLI